MNQFGSTLIVSQSTVGWYGTHVVPAYAIMGGLISLQDTEADTGTGDFSDDFSDDFSK